LAVALGVLLLLGLVRLVSASLDEIFIVIFSVVLTAMILPKGVLVRTLWVIALQLLCVTFLIFFRMT
jgi:hypothetical protein